MRPLLLFILGPSSAFAQGADIFCSNACTVTDGLTCVDRGLGCNPASQLCAPCFDNVHCWPGGTCDVTSGSCMNTICTPVPDGGAGDVGTADGGDAAVDPDAGDGGLVDGGPAMDAAPDAEPDAAIDTGLADTGPLDSGDHPDAVPLLPGGRGKPGSKDDMFDEGCGCSAGGDRPLSGSWPSAGWLGFGLLLFAHRQRR